MGQFPCCSGAIFWLDFEFLESGDLVLFIFFSLEAKIDQLIADTDHLLQLMKLIAYYLHCFWL